MRSFMRLRFGVGFCCVGVLLLAGEKASVRAQVPQLISYQGKLTDLSGEAVNDGTYDMRFSLYDAESAGNLVWGPEEWSSSTQTVPVNEGLFNVLLGKHESLSSTAFDEAYWLEVSVYNGLLSSWETFSPRRPIASAPYALRAGKVVDGSVDTVALATGSVTGDILADNAVTDAKMAASGIAAGRITSGTLNNARFNALSNLGGGTGSTFLRRDGTWASAVTSETDPEVGIIAANYLPRWDGSALVTGSVYDNGNVGIGTTSPQYDLEVYGGNHSAWLSVKSSLSYAGLMIDRSYSGKNGYIMYKTDGNTDWYVGEIGESFANSDFAISTEFSSPDGKFFIKKLSGNVGIGTTSPGEKLHVEGTIEVDQKIQANDSGGLELATDEGTTRLFIKDNGNVGIGTTEPKTELDVNGMARVQGSVWPSSGEGMEFGYNKSINKGYIQVYDRDTDSWGVLYLGEGNVGINTTNPSYKLHVEGSAYATGAYGALSDSRHKTNIRDLSLNAIGIINELRPVSFEWKEPLDPGMEGEQFGLIAQEVEELLPEVVLTQDDEEKTKGLKYTELIPVIIGALQELSAECTMLREENVELKAAIEELK